MVDENYFQRRTSNGGVAPAAASTAAAGPVAAVAPVALVAPAVASLSRGPAASTYSNGSRKRSRNDEGDEEEHASGVVSGAQCRGLTGDEEQASVGGAAPPEAGGHAAPGEGAAGLAAAAAGAAGMGQWQRGAGGAGLGHEGAGIGGGLGSVSAGGAWGALQSSRSVPASISVGGGIASGAAEAAGASATRSVTSSANSGAAVGVTTGSPALPPSLAGPPQSYRLQRLGSVSSRSGPVSASAFPRRTASAGGAPPKDARSDGGAYGNMGVTTGMPPAAAQELGSSRLRQPGLAQPMPRHVGSRSGSELGLGPGPGSALGLQQAYPGYLQQYHPHLASAGLVETGLGQAGHEGGVVHGAQPFALLPLTGGDAYATVSLRMGGGGGSGGACKPPPVPGTGPLRQRQGQAQTQAQGQTQGQGQVQGPGHGHGSYEQVVLGSWQLHGGMRSAASSLQHLEQGGGSGGERGGGSGDGGDSGQAEARREAAAYGDALQYSALLGEAMQVAPSPARVPGSNPGVAIKTSGSPDAGGNAGPMAVLSSSAPGPTLTIRAGLPLTGQAAALPALLRASNARTPTAATPAGLACGGTGLSPLAGLPLDFGSEVWDMLNGAPTNDGEDAAVWCGRLGVDEREWGLRLRFRPACLDVGC